MRYAHDKSLASHDFHAFIGPATQMGSNSNSIYVWAGTLSHSRSGSLIGSLSFSIFYF